MARREALKRLVIGIPYVPLYAFVLYPISLVVGLVLAALSIGWAIMTDEASSFKPELASRIWRFPSDNMRWIISGEGEFELLP